MPKLATNFGYSGTHAARVLFAAKIKKWLSDKWSLMQARARPDGGFQRCHGRKFLSRGSIRYKASLSLHLERPMEPPFLQGFADSRAENMAQILPLPS